MRVVALNPRGAAGAPIAGCVVPLQSVGDEHMQFLEMSRRPCDRDREFVALVVGLPDAD